MNSLSRDNLRIAVIGIGKMGLLHASILNTLPNVELTALCDKSGLIRKFCKKVFDRVHIVDNIDQLLGLDLHAVYVTTPIPAHYPIIRTIYSEGIARNVFAEKTLGSSYDQAKELCALAQSSGRANMVGYMKRFAVTFRKAKDLLNQKVLGELLSFDAYAYSSDFSNIQKNSKTSALRGGVLRDLGAHIIDLAIWFFSDLEVRQAKLESLSEQGPEDSSYINVETSHGLRGHFNISWCVENYRLPEFELVVKGSNGTMKVNDDKVELKRGEKEFRWYRQDLNDNVKFLLGAPEYFREDEHFVKSMLTGCNVEPNFYNASKVDYVIDQAKNESKQK